VRVLGLACRYPDANGADRLADDPIQKVLLTVIPFRGRFQLSTQRGPSFSRGVTMEQWERAEVARSSIEAERTSPAALRVSKRTRARYECPTAATAYPLEFAYHLLGNVRGRQVLELGCGSGENTVCLVARGANVCALDISEELIGLARRRLNVSGCGGGDSCFVVGSAHQLPLPDASVDVVFGIAILHHVDLSLVSREVHRVLRPGGRAIFQEPVRNSPTLRAVRSLIPWTAPDVSPFERPLTDDELRAFAAPFSSMRVRAFCLPHVIVGTLFARGHVDRLYRLDAALLRRIPGLQYYAGIRVIELIR
jgi:SAM-dependent methyltransferase